MIEGVGFGGTETVVLRETQIQSVISAGKFGVTGVEVSNNTTNHTGVGPTVKAISDSTSNTQLPPDGTLGHRVDWKA